MNGIVKPLKKNMANKADGPSISLGSGLKMKFKNTFKRPLNTSELADDTEVEDPSDIDSPMSDLEDRLTSKLKDAMAENKGQKGKRKAKGKGNLQSTEKVANADGGNAHSPNKTALPATEADIAGIVQSTITITALLPVLISAARSAVEEASRQSMHEMKLQLENTN